MLQPYPIQPGQEVVALCGVEGLQFLIVVFRQLQPGHSSLLQGCCRAHGEEVVHLAGTLDDLGGSDEVAQTPAGDRVGLGQRIAGDGVLEHTGQAGHADVLSGRIDDVLIHFIGHHKGVVLDCQLCNGFQLVPAEHLAAGVGGVAQDQCLGTLGKAFLDKRNIKLISRRNQRDINGLCPGKNGVGPVILVKRREDHHLVAGVADGHHGCHHGFGAAAGHADLGVGIHLVVQGRAGLFRQCLTEVLRAKGHGILMRAVVGGLCQRIQQLLRRVKVRKTLRKVDGIVLVIDAGHAADDRIRECAHTVT